MDGSMLKNREYDVAVFGATGYVGHRLVAELVKMSEGVPLKILATARSQEKVQSLSKEFPTVTFDVLNVLEAPRVDALVKRTRLVANCVGPFDLYGENVVSACARLGTHYLDITGEILFVRRMIEKYEDVARKSGAMIVPFAGFDSVPSDLGVYLISQEMKKNYNQKVALVDLVYKVRGGINGGTAATALDMGSKISAQVKKNYYYLAPKMPAREYTELSNPRFIPEIGKYVAPFFMEPINNKVVYRSLALAGPETNLTQDFRYRESVATPGGTLGAFATAASLRGFDTLLKFSSGRKVLSRFLPKPGAGPSERSMQNGFFEATVFATGSDGKKLVRKMKAKGDPGNVSTVKLMMSCIRVVLSNGFSPKGGILTPAIAFGSDILPALRDSGVSWE